MRIEVLTVKCCVCFESLNNRSLSMHYSNSPDALGTLANFRIDLPFFTWRYNLD